MNGKYTSCLSLEICNVPDKICKFPFGSEGFGQEQDAFYHCNKVAEETRLRDFVDTLILISHAFLLQLHLIQNFTIHLTRT